MTVHTAYIGNVREMEAPSHTFIHFVDELITLCGASKPALRLNHVHIKLIDSSKTV